MKKKILIIIIITTALLSSYFLLKMRIFPGNIPNINIIVEDEEGNLINNLPLIYFIRTQYLENIFGIPLLDPGHHVEVNIQKIYSSKKKEKIIDNNSVYFRLYEQYTEEIIIVNCIPKDDTWSLDHFVNRFYLYSLKPKIDKYDSKVIIINDEERKLDTWYSQDGKIPVIHVNRSLKKEETIRIVLKKQY